MPHHSDEERGNSTTTSYQRIRAFAERARRCVVSRVENGDPKLSDIACLRKVRNRSIEVKFEI